MKRMENENSCRSFLVRLPGLGGLPGRRSARSNWLVLTALLLGIVWLAPALRGDDTDTGTGQGPAPDARAARLSYVEGQVKITQGGQLVTDQAPINAPVFEGMQLTTGDNGRAEIQFEDGSVARLSPDSSLTLTALRGQGASGDAEMSLNSGLGYFELQGTGQSGQMGVHFGDYTATASGFTVLRVKMDTPPGDLAVFSGNAHLEGGNGAVALDLHGGESASLNLGDQGSAVVNETIEPDSWDAWNSDRDQALTTEASTQTEAANNVAPDESQNPAWSDLDANGNWYNVPGQGYVWSPYDAANAGWDPYGNGNWMYTPSYGYIWASGYPWGYLPYQCGAWNFYDGFGWGWAPGFGGCQPWWGRGFSGGPRFGGFLPGGYHPPRRPLPPHGPGIGHPVPMIAVNRRMSTSTASFPLRERSAPVTIAGSTVQALRPLGMRPDSERPAADFARHEAQVYGNTGHGMNSMPQRSYGASRGSYMTAPGGQYRSPAPQVRSYSAPSRAPSGGAAVSHPSGGGGGAPHGGGGGGGAAHGGGGGGGGHK